MTDKAKRYQKRAKLLISLGIILVAFASLLFFLKFIGVCLPFADNTLGQYGDVIGGVVGAVWALAGVFLFYAALTEQREAIEDQKEATQASIKALKIQAQELKLPRIQLLSATLD